MTPDEDLAAARAATEGLLAHLSRLSVQDLRGPSLLPGWSRAHVVAHLAGNALSHVRMLDGCLAGEVRTQYAWAGAREAGIEELASRPDEVVAAHAAAAAALEQRWSAMRPEHWERLVSWLDAGTSPARSTVASREKEASTPATGRPTGRPPSPSGSSAACWHGPTCRTSCWSGTAAPSARAGRRCPARPPRSRRG